MIKQSKLKNRSFLLMVSVVAIIIFRFILTITIPLLDKTETRYAEIARIMVETKDWVILQIDYGIPFWAKPPLSTWLSAISFEMFGVNEMAARLPSFLIGVGIVILLGRLMKKQSISFYLPGFILLTMPEFLIHMGVVSTDSTLTFAVVLIMLSFWESIHSTKKAFWNYLFFIAVGLGLLAKGPIVLILTGPPIFIWCLLKKGRFKLAFTKLNWLIGIPITALIAIPWYVMIDHRSPGFTEYFFIGEHFKRFFESGWKGDLYGGPGSAPVGMIWVFLLIFAFPWVQVVFYSLWKNRKTIFKDSWISFLVLWFLWTPFFFTFSSNILHTYILPSLVPLALLVVYWWENYNRKNVLLGVAGFFPIVACITFVFFFVPGNLNEKLNTDKLLLQQGLRVNVDKNIQVFYWGNTSYSSEFYTHGLAQSVFNQNELEAIIKDYDSILFIISKKKLAEIDQKILDQFQLIDFNYKTNIYLRKNELENN